MFTVTLTDAKAHLSELVSRAANGNPVCITRRGRPIARLLAVETPRKRIDLSALQSLTDAMPAQAELAGEFVRRMRDDDRY